MIEILKSRGGREERKEKEEGKEKRKWSNNVSSRDFQVSSLLATSLRVALLVRVSSVIEA